MVQLLEVLLVEGWRGECPICSELSDGHFGHLRFKNFVNIDFVGILCGGIVWWVVISIR